MRTLIKKKHEVLINVQAIGLGCLEKIKQMQSFLYALRDEDREFGPTFEKYFFLHRDKESGMFVYAEPKLQVIRDELELCGYFAIITSEKMN